MCVYSALVLRLILFLKIEGLEGDTSHLYKLESYSGDITDGVTTASESGNKNLVLWKMLIRAQASAEDLRSRQ